MPGKPPTPAGIGPMFCEVPDAAELDEALDVAAELLDDVTESDELVDRVASRDAEVDWLDIDIHLDAPTHHTALWTRLSASQQALLITTTFNFCFTSSQFTSTRSQATTFTAIPQQAL